jgi:hypothetical protein
MKMSKPVFLRNRTRPIVADKIMRDMEDENNPDMSVKWKAYLHGGKGFALEILNMDSISETTMGFWKSIIQGQGFEPRIDTDMLDGKVNISCVPIERRRSYKYLKSLVYLSMFLFCIYTLWSRHKFN